MSKDDTVKAAVRAALSVFTSAPGPQRLPSMALSEGGSREGPTPRASPEVWLIPSCFPQRRATLWVQPADRRCREDVVDEGGDAQSSLSLSSSTVFCVRPLSPRSGAAQCAVADTVTDSVVQRDGVDVFVRQVVRANGPYQDLRFVLSENVTPFTALLATMAVNGFTAVPSRQAPSSHAMSSLRWLKLPTRSEFVRASRTACQKMNHIPGTRRLGNKADLHDLLTAAAARWAQARSRTAGSGVGASSGWHPRPPHRLFPEAWVLPRDAEACLAVLRDPTNDGQLFIAKPCGSAGGQGIFLLHGAPSANVDRCLTRGDGATSEAAAGCTLHGVRQWVIQRYVARPYLVAGHKFDLRLYVVVTSYWPLRLYLYQEGLVRIAASRYHGDSVAGSPDAPQPAHVGALTAHLTNFTVNKGVEADTEGGPSSSPSTEENVKDIREEGPWPGTKWSLAALASYMKATGNADYDGTMSRVHDLLVRVFASAVPEVRSELESIADEQMRLASSHEPSDAPACTVKGISPFFEIYGVDVLLQHPLTPLPSTAGTSVLEPVLMEINIMPSLSTHYSRLDQSIKGCFVADALTLVGLTSHRFKASTKPTLPVVDWPPRDGLNKVDLGDKQRQFLASLPSTAALEACMTAEEERRRAALARFVCLAPTSTSFHRYAPLLEEPGRSEGHLDKLLSEWARCAVHEA